MNQITVKGFYKKGGSVAKFEVNPPLNPNLNKVYFNIDDADDSSLVKHLFYLPFVKKVELKEGFIHIEKFDILEWDAVIDEVADQNTEPFNNKSAYESNRVVKQSISIYAESTPNPNAMKFVANKKLTTQPLLFDKIEQTKEAPMINKLFEYEFVKEVFLDENYISILKKKNFEWDHKSMEIREFIQNYLRKDGEIISRYFDVKTLKKKNKIILLLRLLIEFPMAFLKYYLIRRHFTGALTGLITALILAYFRWKRILVLLKN